MIGGAGAVPRRKRASRQRTQGRAGAGGGAIKSAAAPGSEEGTRPAATNLPRSPGSRAQERAPALACTRPRRCALAPGATGVASSQRCWKRRPSARKTVFCTAAGFAQTRVGPSSVQPTVSRQRIIWDCQIVMFPRSAPLHRCVPRGLPPAGAAIPGRGLECRVFASHHPRSEGTLVRLVGKAGERSPTVVDPTWIVGLAGCGARKRMCH
jgi:hypothetical protein